MPAPRKERSIREDTIHLDVVITRPLLERVERVMTFLGLTKRAAILAVLHEGCAHYERRMLDVEQAAERVG